MSWETRYTHGTDVAIEVWRPDLPKVPDIILRNIVYLYSDPEHAENSDKTGGSGFFIGFESKVISKKGDLYVVTNRHVIEEDHQTIRFSSKDGGTHILDLRGNWIFHPNGDDLAVASLRSSLNLNAISADLLVTSKEMNTSSEAPNTFGLGTEVMFAGRFMGFDGIESNQPSVRFGNISICPPVPINIKRNHKQFPQESLLIEARSLPGYSGSPVYWLRQYHEGGGGLVELIPRHQLKLLGVDYGHLPHWDKIYELDQKTESAGRLRVNLNSGMMGVVPAWKLQELLNLPDLVENRRLNEDQRRKYLQRSGQADLD